ncbi:uncharacterized protein VTP21DRAFT_10512 [Calcarisporiella thermophila]|uniref:uncharacterized protein n=1 Tax=Calcarisporiella thermophila TaxID=911321 RepID=UPI003742026E
MAEKSISLVSYEGSFWRHVLRRLFTRRPLNQLEEEVAHSNFRRSLGALDLIMVGVGAIIGTGIFVLPGKVAGDNAGPAISISFIVAGIASGLAGLSYAEMASMIPVAGSAYTYASATMGEFVAFLIGWSLILEYLLGASTVAVGWSGYTTDFFGSLGVSINKHLTNAPVEWTENAFHVTGDYLNLPAVCICITITIILMFGIRESARFNNIIVTMKVLVVLVFIFACIKFVDPSNYTPFIPENEGSFGRYGVTGMFQAASIVFFAYIGFDAVTTTAQEAKNPQRDLPIGILGSLLVCTVLYIAACLIMTGVVNYKDFARLASQHAAPMALVLNHTGMRWLNIIVDLGAIAGLTSVILVLLIAMPRILYTIGKDGLFPKFTTYLHPRFKTPVYTTIFCGMITAILSGVLPLGVLSELTSAGTLLAFLFVHIGVIYLRFKEPDAPRKFKVPGGKIVILPLIGAALCILLLGTSTTETLYRLAIWVAIGILFYAVYGYRHSRLNPSNQTLEVKVDRSKEENAISEVEDVARV